MGLIALLRGWHERTLVAKHAVPNELWNTTLAQYPFLQRAGSVPRLREMTALFLGTKEFCGVDGLQVTDAMAVAVAAQACMPVLNLGLGLYRGTRGIVLHPFEARARRVEPDEHGLVHEWSEELSGEAMAGGPMVLAWSAVEQSAHQAPEAPVFNVVIHEFVHVIDMANGAADGIPPLPSARHSAIWLEGLTRAWDRFSDRVAHRESSCMDPYGAAQIDEFFAVASEAFFVQPTRLKKEDPPLFDQLAGFFGSQA
jgi:MtfA peptidase